MKRLATAERTLCNDVDAFWERLDADWSDGPYGYPYRTCAHCGGIHPDDALQLMNDGAVVGGTDKSYKRYLEKIPNPLAGQITTCGGSSSGGPYNTPIDYYATAPAYTHAKIYFWHFDERRIELFNGLLRMGVGLKTKG